jgi:SAM-dependent MidA family methyltransferase
VTPLKQKILDRIRREGPIGVPEYMRIALMDPEHGYYMRGDPLGAAGDFITAPEVSQLFGEMIGLFLVQAWEDRGSPKRFHLAELGPGRGTLMADILRTAKIRPFFRECGNGEFDRGKSRVTRWSNGKH